MDKAEYHATQGLIMSMAQLVQPADLEGFIKEIEFIHATGPSQDPVIYARFLDSLILSEKIARALLVFKNEVNRLYGDIKPKEEKRIITDL